MKVRNLCAGGEAELLLDLNRPVMFLPKLNFGSTSLILKIELYACITLLLIVHKCDCGSVLE